MRIFRAKKEITILSYPPEMIHKGEVFNLDNFEELPGYSKETFDESWEELVLYNNYGSIKLTPK